MRPSSVAPATGAARPLLPRASAVACACACACATACTLLNSRDGLVGPPLVAGNDAGAQAEDAAGTPTPSDAAATDAAPPQSPAADGSTVTPLPDATTPPRPDASAANDGGPTAIYTQLLSPLGIAVYSSQICWTAGDSLRMIQCAPTSGGSASQITTAASQTNDALVADAFDVAFDDTYLYWSNGPKNQIVRRTFSGGTSAQYFTGDQQLSYIFLDGTSLWASDYVAGSTSGNLVVGPSGTSSQLIYPGETQAAGVGLYSGSVYWGRGSPGSVSSGPTGGNATITRVPTSASVTGLALDAAGTAYFIVGDQQIFQLAQGSNTPDLLYDEGTPFGDSDLAIDDGSIYWSEHDLGQIMRMPKP